MNHIPPYIAKYDEFKAKGVDVIAVVAANDAFVMSGWGRSLGLKDKVRLRPSSPLPSPLPSVPFPSPRLLTASPAIPSLSLPLPSSFRDDVLTCPRRS